MKNVFSKIIDGIKAVAPTVANVVMPGSGPLLHTLMRAVTGDGPDMPVEMVAQKIEADPKLFLELQTRAMDHEARMMAIEAQKLGIVNATMQAEAKSDKWPQYSWRPFNGFSFPVTIMLIYFVLPLAEKVVPAVSPLVWGGWLSILGVATYDRGKEKRAKAGEQRTGLIEGALNAIRGN